ncbi:hypothetical protein OROGR_029190 [Orobanche gracilis]
MTTWLTAAMAIPAATRDRWFAITAAGRSSPEVVRDSRPGFGSIQSRRKLEDWVVKQLGRVKFFETSGEHRAESSIR